MFAVKTVQKCVQKENCNKIFDSEKLTKNNKICQHKFTQSTFKLYFMIIEIMTKKEQKITKKLKDVKNYKEWRRLNINI